MRAVIDGIAIENDAEGVAAGVIIGRRCAVAPAPEGLERVLEQAIAEARSRSGIEALTVQVRDMLRFGKYKPTGRAKPASEYLHKAALEGRFPRINNLVDINNLISLRSLLPISLIDLDLAKGGSFVIRRGRAGESYVFNSGGQVIELADLLLVAELPADEPSANPVKDSMRTKLVDSSTDVMAVIYAPGALLREVEDATASFASALREWGGAERAESVVISPPQ